MKKEEANLMACIKCGSKNVSIKGKAGNFWAQCECGRFSSIYKTIREVENAWRETTKFHIRFSEDQGIVTQYHKRRQFGNWLKKKREKAKLTQKEAAHKIGFENKANIVAYENAISPVPVKRLFDIAEAYNIPMAELIEKIRDCEPRIYADFIELEEKFEKAFFDKMRGFAKAHGAEIRAHHRPFPSSLPGEGLGSDNVRYRNQRNFLDGSFSIYYVN